MDFGKKIGVKKTSAQITKLYKKDQLVGRQIISAINLKPKQVGPFISEFLLAGFIQENGEVVLAVPERQTKNGLKLL